MDLMQAVKTGFGELAQDDDVKQRALENVAKWLDDPRLEAYRPYIEHLAQEKNFPALLDSFWRMIPFGTGGRRGPVGAGPNRLNPHTIALSVQGHCQYLAQRFAERERRVVVAYDVRCFHDLRGLYAGVNGPLEGLTSRDMAKASAMTYAANGVTAYVVGPLEDGADGPVCTDRFISTPELSFLIRELDCVGGLNVSASHNHPDDNGGKFYNGDGGQEVPPHDEELLEMVETIEEVRSMSYAEARAAGLIRLVPSELHDAYLDENCRFTPTDSRAARVAFSPLCGTGTTTVGEALDRLGFEVETVPDQSVYDGSFAPVRYRLANPEVPGSLDRLEQVARETGCDIGLATDPDADRLGLIARDGEESFAFVNGNEIGILLLESIMQTGAREGGLPDAPIFINTLVTSSLQRTIARRYGCQVVGDLMVGFKYMGDVLGHVEKSGCFPPDGDGGERDEVRGTVDDFVLATEESHGYLLSHRIRDKDACGAAVHLAGLASVLKERGSSIPGLLRDIYRVYGYTRNELRSMIMEGIVGLKRIGRIQDRLRANPPEEIGGRKVVRFVDNHVVGGPLKSSTDAASRNVLLFELDGGDDRVIRLVVRPSGTEPKTKVYVEVPSAAPYPGTLHDAYKENIDLIENTELDRLIAATDAEARELGDAFIRYCLGPEVLGDVYPAVPDEALLVSDLVPVDQKIRITAGVLPELGARLGRGETEGLEGWLAGELAPLGEDPLGLIGAAANAWVDRAGREGVLDEDGCATARALFETK